MSRTLSLTAQRISLAQQRLDLGRASDARTILEAVLTLPELPRDEAALAHRLLGQIYQTLRREALARKHFRESLRCDDSDFDTRLAWVASLERDRRIDRSRVQRMYRRLLKRSTRSAAAWAGYGRTALQRGEDARGVRALRKAVYLAPESLEYVADLADALVGMRRFESARKVVMAARFRFRDSVAVQRIWNDFCFDEARAKQRTQAERQLPELEPIILPFLRLETGTSTALPGGGILRVDRASQSLPHLAKLRAFRRGPNRLA
ncbi:tetratricopeptide repeat protein [Tuwongella immobilis]|uniref:Tpr repeat-containing protein:: TPR_2 n=1 Tax=Tuwongella immobilis TaxID=692036 RepID=A0A6C2YJZ9_9BACT|nr:tetratricopeptide repeat protein [Tuwongella immobilis]VIP01621.1 tpr repeat-containing protein : : TPR_2 [Tuwongella immobilis]VTR98952.1 tpr repeat-containing protein : : TPR_2 [Tuwongella immobilis]